MRPVMTLPAVFLASACSFFLNASDKQCSSYSDCGAHGGEFVGAICGRTGVCRPCTTNKECIDGLGKAAMCIHPKVECHAREQSNAEAQIDACTQERSRCQVLESVDCKTILGDPANDDAVLIGSLFSLTGSNALAGLARMKGVENAFKEISSVGIPSPGRNARTLVVLECDEGANVTRAATHLVQDLRVAAIVGPESSQDTTDVSHISIPSGTLLISPSATSKRITDLVDNDLVWRTAPSDVLQTQVLVDQLAALESAFVTAHPNTKTKVAFVYSEDDYGRDLLDLIFAKAKLNGKALDDAENQSQILKLNYPHNAENLQAQVSQVLAAAPRPAIVVGLGSREIASKFLTPLEAGWGAEPPPEYLFSDAVHKQELLDAVSDDRLRKRVRGTIPAPQATAAFHAFVAKYGTPQVLGVAGAYDSMFLITYALVDPPKVVTGDVIQKGFRYLVDGPKVDVGGANLSMGFQALFARTDGGAAATFNFEGASGPLDFDLDRGEAPSNIEVWCIGTDQGKPVFGASGRYYDASRAEIIGSFTPCN